MGLLATLLICSSATVFFNVVNAVKPFCDFEDGDICWSAPFKSSDYKWKVSLIPPSFSPATDHTSGRGRYLYADGSLLAKYKDKAKLLSGSLEPTSLGGACVSFWYHMSGANIGTLLLFKKNVIRKEAAVNLWSKSGDQGRKWNFASVTVLSSAPYQLTFEAVRGSAFEGSKIALDDIKFQRGKCKQSWLLSKCGINMKGLGCFKDSRDDRVYGELLATHRKRGGQLLDWSDYETSLIDLLCECARLTKAKGYKQFGLEFYGECWSGPGDIEYNRLGESTGCINGKFKAESCQGPGDGACVGQEYANYVYELE